ncbi:hypothetical protein acsn021_14240 [Anaerocolumna cellulosilytica]|uniref:Uncharacterized protein n=1 Tax=Anaerocolumna cellulosilytica TaxID=433286 RepID=A0A6S6R2V3_9FIRM|nr:DUF2264 domain-containing protein [Anaerocolumna cellulosilytica]MBB5195611.1 hypothetical protein [Anaerocolumna cellulosilytica]BCJ93855.1 hypothetical protein acsn021_14240 [Anaerocolumna cellulosilytica]
MIFQPNTLDFTVSPYTGLTRDSWIEAGEYLLTGIFKNIKSMHDPIIMPRKETEVTYPHKNASKAQREIERKAEIFEGLARSFFLAAPLIHNNPDITICSYKLRDYYKEQVLRACTKGDSNSVGSYEEQLELAESKDTFRTFQQTVETCALVICLWSCKAELWDTYTKEEKDIIAVFLSSYAHASTVPQNWRLFNMLDMAFLYKEGYSIDEDIMRDHGQAILNFYAGDGWYRDGHSFDYYSCWAFNVYTPIWNLWYGYEKEPYLAQKFEENSNKLMETYSDFFDCDGFTNMWGRSNIYRNASTSAFDGNMMLRNSTADPGLARRISSGSLLQFLTREDFLHEGIPTLGFYGQFTPLVQGYSCAESPFWLGKAFLCLHLPSDHPFWTAIENNGIWEKLRKNEIKETTLNGPALCFTNHEANGETILRSGKVVRNCRDEHGMWNYSKLCFNSKYPWESAPSKDVEAQQYVLKDSTTGDYSKANVTFWHGKREGVLYRRQFFHYEISKECTWIQAVNLADFPVAHGIVRVDKLKLHRRPISMTLGAYGFPDNGTEIIRLEKENAKAIILKGHDFTGREKQLAMTLYDGWEEIGFLNSEGTNPDSKKSIIVYGKLTSKKQYGYEPYIMISQVITKESLEDFTEEEIFSIASVEYTDKEKCGGYGPVQVLLKDGDRKVIEFEGMEGNLQL